MDQDKLRESALQLEAALGVYRTQSPELQAVYRVLKPLLDMSIAGTLAAPVPWNEVPCGHPFSEGDYAAFPEVEKAYSSFKLQVTDSASRFEEIWKGKP